MAKTKASTNKNFMQSQNYTFAIDRITTVVYNLQGLDFPGITLNQAPVYAGPTAETDPQYPGEKITYDPITVRALLDENMVGYFEIVDWMRAAAKSPGLPRLLQPGQRIKEFSDATLIITTNKFNLNIKTKFVNMWPTNIGPINFDYTIGPDVVPIYDVTFIYHYYTVER